VLGYPFRATVIVGLSLSQIGEFSFILSEILCDADLDYLGRADFIPVSQNLFRELFERNKVKTIEEWNKMQIKFIEGHQYYTETARQLRNVNKANQLDKLRSMI